MRRLGALLCLVLGACTAAPPRPPTPAPEPVALTFDWSRVGRLGIGFETVHRTGPEGASGRRYLGRFELLTEATPSGLRLVSQGLALEEAPPVSTIPDAIARLSVTGIGNLEVDRAGQLQTVTGTEEVVLGAIGPALPAFEALRQKDRKRFLMEIGIGMPLLVRRNSRALWGRLVGQWAGKTVVPGVEVTGTRSETDEVLGPAKRDTRYTFTITTGVSCGEGEPAACVQLESRAQAVAREDADPAMPMDQTGTHEAFLVLVTDPATLIPRRMVVQERMTLTTASEGPHEIFRETRYAFHASSRRAEPQATPRQLAHAGARALLDGNAKGAVQLLAEAEATAQMLKDGVGQASAAVVRVGLAIEGRDETQARLAVRTLLGTAPRSAEARIFDAWLGRWEAAGRTDALDALFAAWEAAGRPDLLGPRLLPPADNNRPRPVKCESLLDTTDARRVMLARVEAERCPELGPLARTHPGPDAGIAAWISALSAVATQASDDEPERVRWIARTILEDLVRVQPDNGLWPVWQIVGNAGPDAPLTDEDLTTLEAAMKKGLDLQQETLTRAFVEAYQSVGIARPEERGLRAAMVVLPVEAIPALIRRARATKDSPLMPRAAAVLEALAGHLVEESSALAALLAPTLRREAAELRDDEAATERYLNQEESTEALVSHGRHLHEALTRWPIPGLQTALAARFRAGELAWYSELTRRMAETPEAGHPPRN